MTEATVGVLQQQRLALSYGGREVFSLGRKGIVIAVALFAGAQLLGGLHSLARPRTAGELALRELVACGAEQQVCRERLSIQP